MAVYEATGQNFDELIKTGYAVVDFSGENCGWCVKLEPIYTKASNDYAMLRFLRVNSTRDPELAKRFGVQPIPDLLYFRDGELVHRNLGFVEREQLDRDIARLLYGEES